MENFNHDAAHIVAIVAIVLLVYMLGIVKRALNVQRIEAGKASGRAHQLASRVGHLKHELTHLVKCTDHFETQRGLFESDTRLKRLNKSHPERREAENIIHEAGIALDIALDHSKMLLEGLDT